MAVERADRAEESFRDFLHYLGRSIYTRQRAISGDEPWPSVAFLLLGRPESFPSDPFTKALKQRRTSLRRTADYVKRLFPDHAMAASLTASLHRLSQGEPCVIAEAVERMQALGKNGAAEALAAGEVAVCWPPAALGSLSRGTGPEDGMRGGGRPIALRGVAEASGIAPTRRLECA